MKKLLVAILLSMSFCLFAETYTVKVTGKAFVKYEDGQTLDLEKEDILDDEEDAILVVQPNSKVTLEIDGRQIVLKNGEYKYSDLFKKK